MSELKKAYEIEMSRIRDLIEELPWGDPAFYCEWMAQTYFYSSYSTRIIGLAGCLFPLTRDRLHVRFMDHAGEEKNHEKILIHDLKEQGRTIDEYACFSSTAAIYRTQYYWIQNVNPMSVYGYFFFLEGLAVAHGKRILEAARKGNPEKSLRFLKVHVEDDVDHVATHFKVLEDLDHQELEMIKENMRQTGDYYAAMLKDVAAKAVKDKQKEAA